LATEAAVRERRLVKMLLVLILVGGEDARGGDAARGGCGSLRPPSGGYAIREAIIVIERGEGEREREREREVIGDPCCGETRGVSSIYSRRYTGHRSLKDLEVMAMVLMMLESGEVQRVLEGRPEDRKTGVREGIQNGVESRCGQQQVERERERGTERKERREREDGP
jgi:hypothetical protein